MRIPSVVLVFMASIIVHTASAADADLLVAPADAPLYQLSNFRTEVDQVGGHVMRFDFQRTREGSNGDSVTVQGKSKQGVLTIAAHIPSFTESGTMELKSLFPNRGQQQVNIEVYLVLSHNWGDGKLRYSVVSNAVRLGDPGPSVQPRKWTEEEEKAYEHHKRVMADDSAQKPSKSYPVGIDVPEDSQFVPSDAKVTPGTPLAACYADKWNPLTALSENEDGSINVRWDAYGAKYDCSMKRDELIVKTAYLVSSAAGTFSTLSRKELEKRGLIQEPAKPLKSYPVSIDVPNHSVVVPADLKLKAGVKLMACYAGKWNPLTTLSENHDGTVNVRWDDYGPTYDCSMVRKELIIRRSLRDGLQKDDDEGASASSELAGFRTWTDATGKFSVKAKLVRKSASTVTLATESGREVTLPVAKLSEADRELLE